MHMANLHTILRFRVVTENPFGFFFEKFIASVELVMASRVTYAM